MVTSVAVVARDDAGRATRVEYHASALGKAIRYVLDYDFVVLAVQDFVAGLNDQFISLIVKPLVSVVGDGAGLLQDGVRRDHFAGHQIFADTEMLEGPLCLSTPKLVSGNTDLSEAVSLYANFAHGISPFVKNVPTPRYTRDLDWQLTFRVRQRRCVARMMATITSYCQVARA